MQSQTPKFPQAYYAPPPPEPQEPEFDFDLKEYIHKIQGHWRLILVCLILAIAAGTVKFFMTPKEYQARAVLQIERRSSTAILGTNSPWLENWWNLEYYPTQERLLTSRGLAEKVVRDLRLYDDPAFSGTRARPVESGVEEPTADIDQATVASLANRIRGGLSVSRVRETQLMQLTYRSRSPEIAARLANGFAEAFIDWGIEKRSRTADQASTFLANQAEALRAEIIERERKLQDLSRQADIVDLDPESSVTLQRLNALNQDWTDAKRQRIENEADYQELLRTPSETVANRISGGEVSELRAGLLRLEEDYSTRLSTFKPEWPEMKELNSRIEAAREHLQSVINENADKAVSAARAEWQAALRQERALEGEIAELKSATMDEKSQSLMFFNLQDEAENQRDLLNELLRRQSETEVTARLQDTRESNVRIVDTALIPGGPFRPSLKRNLTLALLAGLGLGLGLAAMLEFMDRSIKTADELERVTGLPTLAVIPDINKPSGGYGYSRLYYGYGGTYGSGGKSGKSNKAGSGRERRRGERGGEDLARIELLPFSHPRLAVSEAYRSLRTAVLLSTADDLRILSVTSAEAGEGKTATASNLAVVMAQLGRKVLLLDADLRKPRQHQVFGISNRVGLVSYLTGGAPLDNTVFQTSVENLFIGPSGPVPPNPSELLASERMQRFTQELRSRFDLVIIDTPPTLAVTDSTIVGTYADGVVLCCRAGSLQKDAARECRDRLHRAEARILGNVLNAHRSGVAGSSSYRKYQYYAAYGAEEESSSQHPAA
ncbi:MAG: polysaccharide biosynthesis tyrosine autokinase [Acidobacteriota bacterium]